MEKAVRDELRKTGREFLEEERAVGVVELILILVEIYTPKMYVFHVFCVRKTDGISTGNTLLSASVFCVGKEKNQWIVRL